MNIEFIHDYLRVNYMINKWYTHNMVNYNFGQFCRKSCCKGGFGMVFEGEIRCSVAINKLTEVMFKLAIGITNIIRILHSVV